MPECLFGRDNPIDKFNSASSESQKIKSLSWSIFQKRLSGRWIVGSILPNRTHWIHMVIRSMIDVSLRVFLRLLLPSNTLLAVDTSCHRHKKISWTRLRLLECSFTSIWPVTRCEVFDCTSTAGSAAIVKSEQISDVGPFTPHCAVHNPRLWLLNERKFPSCRFCIWRG